MSEIVLSILQEHDYNFIGYINKGGFGCCYLVRSLKYELNFVCKVVPDDDYDKSFLLSYKREVEALSKLNHPNIVRVYDVFTSANFLFIILEYCSGGNLQSIVEKSANGIDFHRVTKYAVEIIDALGYMHSKGYAHCDIKPSNILIDEFGRAKLADFGLSHFVDLKIKSTTNSHGGSLCFMSPELLLNKSNNPFKADIWALGVTLYILNTSRFPFKGKNMNTLLREIEFGPQQIPNIPEELWNVIDACLQIEPESRKSCLELREILVKRPNAELSMSYPMPRRTRHFSIFSKQPVILQPFKMRRTSCSSVY